MERHIHYRLLIKIIGRMNIILKNIYSLMISDLFGFICVVNEIFEIVFCIVDVWFDINKLDAVNSRERKVELGFVSVDIVWVEVSVSKTVGKLVVWDVTKDAIELTDDDNTLSLDAVKNVVSIADGDEVVVLIVSNMLDENIEGALLIVLNKDNKVDIVVVVSNELDIIGVELVSLA